MAAMRGRTEVEGRRAEVLPPLAAEDHVCQACRVSYQEISVERAGQVIRSVPTSVREAIAAVPPQALRSRPNSGTWSVMEYVCHLRDVYVIYTIRLYRARTECRPMLEPMLNDLRARRFRYNDRDVEAVLDELAANASGFLEEITRVGQDDWDRVVTRLPGEQRTALWLVRQAMHEGQHHLSDIRATRTAVTST